MRYFVLWIQHNFKDCVDFTKKCLTSNIRHNSNVYDEVKLHLTDDVMNMIINHIRVYIWGSNMERKQICDKNQRKSVLKELLK